MPWLSLVAYFFGGAFLANAIPHFVSGMMGRPFQSPFAKPPGQGLSSSTVNVLWGFCNIVVGYLLVCRVGDFDLRATERRRRAWRGRAADRAVSARAVRPLQRRQSPTGVHERPPFRASSGRCGVFNYRLWARGRARLQRRHLDAAHGPGLAGAHPAHPPQRVGGRHRHGAAVRAACFCCCPGPASPPTISTSASS